MKIPQKTFLKLNCQLFESDLESNGQVKPHRVMQLLQDVATTHAAQIGVGWDVLDRRGMLWILSKINLIFDVPVTLKNGVFSLYTWPLAPTKYFAERCFCAVGEDGRQLFSATSLWMIISREERKILPAFTMNEFFKGEYSDEHSDAPNSFVRVRKDETFSFSYEKEIRRSDLDKNGHVNNTNYATFATDVLLPHEEVCGMQIVFDKELKLYDKIQVFDKRIGENVYIVGERDGQTSFSAVLELADKGN